MIDDLARPRGPYSLALTARLAGDATRRFCDGHFVAPFNLKRTPEEAAADLKRYL